MICEVPTAVDHGHYTHVVFTQLVDNAPWSNNAFTILDNAVNLKFRNDTIFYGKESDFSTCVLNLRKDMIEIFWITLRDKAEYFIEIGFCRL